MKRIFSILALASVFSLAVPVSSEAAPPRKDKPKPTSVEKKRHDRSDADRRSTPHRPEAVRSSPHRHGVLIGRGYHRYPLAPVVPVRHRGRGLFDFVIRF